MEETTGAATAGFPDTTTTFKYDYLGRRVEKKVARGTTTESHLRFVWRGWLLVAELNAASDNALVRTYTWGPDISGSFGGAGGNGGVLIFQDHTSTVNESFYPAYDAQGNVTGLIDTAGNLDAAYEYDPFGKLIRHAGPRKDSMSLLYGTKYTDMETGLIYFGYRYYDPRQGRFINRDPIGEAGGLNLYGFVGNSPTNWVDFLGLELAFIQNCGPWNSTSYWRGEDSGSGGTIWYWQTEYWQSGCLIVVGGPVREGGSPSGGGGGSSGGGSGGNGSPGNGVDGEEDSNPCPSGLSLNEKFAYLNSMREYGDIWEREVANTNIPALIAFVKENPDYTYASNPNTWPRPTNILSRHGNPGLSVDFRVLDGSILETALDRAIQRQFNGVSEMTDIPDHDRFVGAGRNMNTRTTGRITAGSQVGNVAMEAILSWAGSKNRYGFGISTSGYGIFISDRLQNRRDLRHRFFSDSRSSSSYVIESEGRQIIDGIVDRYQSVENPYQAQVEKCKREWGL